MARLSSRRRHTSRRRTSRKLGSGSRFAALVHKLEARGDVADPRALAASIGRRKYGSRGFAKLAAAGRRRSSLRANSYPNWILESVDGDFEPCTLSDFIDANRETFSAAEIRTISHLRPGETLSGGGGGWGEWTIRRQADLRPNGLAMVEMIALATIAVGVIFLTTRSTSGSSPTDARAEYSAALREFASAKGAHAAALLRTTDHPQDTALREAYNATVVRFAAATARIEAARAAMIRSGLPT